MTLKYNHSQINFCQIPNCIPSPRDLPWTHTFQYRNPFFQSAFSTKYDASHSFEKVYSNLMLKVLQLMHANAVHVNINLSPNKVRVFKRLKSAFLPFTK